MGLCLKEDRNEMWSLALDQNQVPGNGVGQVTWLVQSNHLSTLKAELTPAGGNRGNHRDLKHGVLMLCGLFRRDSQ